MYINNLSSQNMYINQIVQQNSASSTSGSFLIFQLSAAESRHIFDKYIYLHVLVLPFLAKERNELIYSLLVMFLASFVFPQVCWATDEMYARDFRHSNSNKILHSGSELLLTW